MRHPPRALRHPRRHLELAVARLERNGAFIAVSLLVPLVGLAAVAFPPRIVPGVTAPLWKAIASPLGQLPFRQIFGAEAAASAARAVKGESAHAVGVVSKLASAVEVGEASGGHGRSPTGDALVPATGDDPSLAQTPGGGSAGAHAGVPGGDRDSDGGRSPGDGLDAGDVPDGPGEDTWSRPGGSEVRWDGGPADGPDGGSHEDEGRRGGTAGTPAFSGEGNARGGHGALGGHEGLDSGEGQTPPNGGDPGNGHGNRLGSGDADGGAASGNAEANRNRNGTETGNGPANTPGGGSGKGQGAGMGNGAGEPSGGRGNVGPKEGRGEASRDDEENGARAGRDMRGGRASGAGGLGETHRSEGARP